MASQCSVFLSAPAAAAALNRGSLRCSPASKMRVSRGFFFGGEHALQFNQLVPHNRRINSGLRFIRRKPGAPRANQSDVPAYKGFPPMQTKPAWYWRLLACIPYLMPLCESWMYAETAANLHNFIDQFELWTYPFLKLLGRLPSWFLLAYFFVAYLGIVRKNIWPHFFRFHVVTGMLLEIILQVMGTCNDWIPQGIYWGKIGAHFWLAVFFWYLLTTLQCIRFALSGMYADIPFISDAAYMQIPYD